MGVLIAISTSVQLVPVTHHARVQSINFSNNTEGSESRVRLLTGGSAGTAVFDVYITDGSEMGDRHFSHTWSKDGGSLPVGLYVEITGTLTVNLEYARGIAIDG